ncbi:hypothetical protein MUK42_32107 [Musa troglodytarum]|uniref:AMP-activated protein kinase glycogen-binding domain-containing protein n=1 Tax=Musa troglodytarum TaxID=320322 RepID=A0A9E7GLR4_9LILI|nr:hypothetical protein MUK42_32107 [Musa troglodytarum]
MPWRGGGGGSSGGWEHEGYQRLWWWKGKGPAIGAGGEGRKRERRVSLISFCLISLAYKNAQRAFAISLGEEPSSLSEMENVNDVDDTVPTDSSDEVLPQKLKSDELKALLVDTERKRLLKKLSEANQYNRFLKRQLLIEEDAVAKFKVELAVLELELQASTYTLVSLAEEIANSGVQLDSRKINGRYIQSHLLARLEAIHEKVKEQIKDVDALKFEVTLFWVGMAESVQVMGSFDGWTQGEEMSPEYTGDYARFSATLKLRPGRYEIKFLVDGEWQLSPEFPTVGEGIMQNNLLVVEQNN